MQELLVASNLANDAIWCKLYHPSDTKRKYHLSALGFHYHSYGYANKKPASHLILSIFNVSEICSASIVAVFVAVSFVTVAIIA